MKGEATNAEEEHETKPLVIWGKKTRNRLELRDGNNLLNSHYDMKSNFITEKQDYLKWLDKYFSFQQFYRLYWYLAAMDLSRNHAEGRNIEIKREGFGIMLRSSQTWFKEDLKRSIDADICDNKCMSLRLQSNTSRILFGTRFLPLIRCDDPLRWKIIRYKHELGLGTTRRTHNLDH